MRSSGRSDAYRALERHEAAHRSLAPLLESVEDAIDMVNVEYLDVLIDVTGDDYMGSVTIG
jgi:hypothetical protein